MNLNSYGDALTTIDRTKTWINLRYKVIFSREVKYRAYYNLSKRYNKTTNSNDYFLIVADYPIDDRKWVNKTIDDYGRFKIFVPDNIFKSTILSSFEKDTNINIEYKEGDDVCDVYYLDI